MDVHDEIAEAEKGNFEANLRAMNVVINFAPGFLQIFQKLQSTYYVSRDAELFESQEPDAPRVGFVRVGDTVSVLHNASSNFARCQLKRKDGLVGWTHAYAPGGQRVLSLHDPGIKQIAAIPIEGLGWQVVSKKELQLTTSKGQRVTLSMALPPNMLVEQLEAKAAEVATIKSKAVQIGAQAHRQWKSSHSVSTTAGAAEAEEEADLVTRPQREELAEVLDDVQKRLQSAASGAVGHARQVAEQCLVQLGRYPPKVWWLQGLSTTHTDMVIWAEDMLNGQATLSPRAITPASPFPGSDPSEVQAESGGEKLDLEQPDPTPRSEHEPELELEPEPEITGTDLGAQEEQRLPIVTLEEQVYSEAQPMTEPEAEDPTPPQLEAAEEGVAQSAEILIASDSAVEQKEDAEGPESIEEPTSESADGNAVESEVSPSALADGQVANGKMTSAEASSDPQASASDFQAALSTESSSRESRVSDATLRRRREFAARRKRELAAQSEPNDYSTVGFSVLRDPDVAQLVSEAMERDRRIDELRHHRPVYRDMYSRRRRRGNFGRGDGDKMMLPIHLPAQQPSLRDGLDVARAPRAWTLSRPHSREGAHVQASRGAHLSVNIPRPNSRDSVGFGSDSTHWGHNDFLTVQESERNRRFAFNESFTDSAAMVSYAIGDDLRPRSPLPQFEARPASPSGFGISAPQRPQSPPSDVWHFDTGIMATGTEPPDAGAGISRTVPSVGRLSTHALSSDKVGSRRRSIDASPQKASIDAFAPHSAVGGSSTASRARASPPKTKHTTNYEMRFFNSPTAALIVAAATADEQGQRYDTLRGMVPRATTPNLPPPIRVEKMPEPAPTLPLTLDDLLAGTTSTDAGAPRPATKATKPKQQPKPKQKQIPQGVHAMVPQITVRAVVARAK